MGNDQSFNRSVARQEAYVRSEMSKINPSSNYVGYDRYTSSGRERRYTTNQIEGKLRQEYHGMNTYKTRDSYVLSSDWERMRASKR